jgi:hypothetical protein
MTSSLHGPNGLGYTHATMVISISGNNLKIGANLLKIILVRIMGCNSPI